MLDGGAASAPLAARARARARARLARVDAGTTIASCGVATAPLRLPLGCAADISNRPSSALTSISGFPSVALNNCANRVRNVGAKALTSERNMDVLAEETGRYGR